MSGGKTSPVRCKSWDTQCLKRAGRTQPRSKPNEVSVGRQILCRENPKMRATSPCAKKLAQTVNAAKRGLTAAQLTLWRQMIYSPAVLKTNRFCEKLSMKVQILGDTNPNAPDQDRGVKILTPEKKYQRCIKQVLSGARKFKGIFGKQYKWSDYLINGAKIIKKLPQSRPATDGPSLGGNPGATGTQPND